MKRYLSDEILKDIHKKIILISGPRQSGKTTITRAFYTNAEYFNFDSLEDRLALLKKNWRRDCDLLIFDELHKMRDWKRWLKGIYDTEGIKPPIIVTGSANLESYSKVGDSLAGRYFQFRLHPIDLKEAVTYWQDDRALAFEHLMNYSGFPEPFLAGNERDYRRWQRTHLDIILRQDLLDLKSVKSIQSIETLIVLLTSRVGSTLSFSNLARDLEVDPKTIKSWIALLENLYVVFIVPPYHANIARSLLKESKCYFFDFGRVADYGARLENLVACALKKACHFLEDTTGKHADLYFLRTKDGQEIDFLIVVDQHPILAIEVKTSDATSSKAFQHFDQHIKPKHKVQLVLNLQRETDTATGVQIRRLVDWLATFNLNDY